MTGKEREKRIAADALLGILQQPLGAYWEARPGLPIRIETAQSKRVTALSGERGIGYRVETRDGTYFVDSTDVLQPNPWTIVFRGKFGLDEKYGAVFVLRNTILWARHRRAAEDARWQAERERVRAAEHKLRQAFETRLSDAKLDATQLVDALNADKWIIARGRFAYSHGPARGQAVRSAQLEPTSIVLHTDLVTMEVPIGAIFRVSDDCLEIRQTVYTRQKRRRTLGGGYREIKEYCTTLQFVRSKK